MHVQKSWKSPAHNAFANISHGRYKCTVEVMCITNTALVLFGNGMYYMHVVWECGHGSTASR